MSLITGLDSDQILIGTANGVGLWLAPIDTEAPEDVEEEWGDGWTPLGYASEDGVTLANSVDQEEFRAWQSLSPVRTAITGRTVTVQFQLLQYSAQNMALYWDIDVPTVGPDGGFSFSVRTDQSAKRHSVGVDIRDGDNLLRYIFPRVQLQEVGDQALQRGSLAMLDVTFTALETNGRLLDVIGRVPSAADTGGGGGPSPSPAPPGPGAKHIDQPFDTGGEYNPALGSPEEGDD